MPVASPAGVLVSADNSRLELAIVRSIVGRVDLAASVPEANVTESIVDGAGGDAFAAPGAAAAFERCTVLGAARAKTVSASNSIFTGALDRDAPADRLRALQFACRGLEDAAAASLPARSCAVARRARCGRREPASASCRSSSPTRMATAAYTQLAQSCALEIRTGADDGAEMGVWALLAQPQREANLLDEPRRIPAVRARRRHPVRDLTYKRNAP